MNEKKLDKLIDEYVILLEQDNIKEGLVYREKKRDFFQSYDYKKIISLNYDEMIEYLKKLWNVLPVAANKICDNNDFDFFKNQLANLLYGNGTFKERYNYFHENISEFKASAMSEVLSYIYPDDFMIWNNKVKKIYTKL